MKKEEKFPYLLKLENSVNDQLVDFSERCKQTKREVLRTLVEVFCYPENTELLKFIEERSRCSVKPIVQPPLKVEVKPIKAKPVETEKERKVRAASENYLITLKEIENEETRPKLLISEIKALERKKYADSFGGENIFHHLRTEEAFDLIKVILNYWNLGCDATEEKITPQEILEAAKFFGDFRAGRMDSFVTGKLRNDQGGDLYMCNYRQKSNSGKYY